MCWHQRCSMLPPSQTYACTCRYKLSFEVLEKPEVSQVEGQCHCQRQCKCWCRWQCWVSIVPGSMSMELIHCHLKSILQLAKVEFTTGDKKVPSLYWQLRLRVFVQKDFNHWQCTHTHTRWTYDPSHSQHCLGSRAFRSVASSTPRAFSIQMSSKSMHKHAKSLTHSLTHWPTHSLTHSLTRSHALLRAT